MHDDSNGQSEEVDHEDAIDDALTAEETEELGQAERELAAGLRLLALAAEHPDDGTPLGTEPFFDAALREGLILAKPRLFERGPGTISPEDLFNRFTYHPPDDTQTVRYQAMREFALKVALFIKQNSPASREQSLAVTHLEEVVFWFNASIARNEAGTTKVETVDPDALNEMVDQASDEANAAVPIEVEIDEAFLSEDRIGRLH